MRFLIDANLPYRFELWRGEQFQHVFDLDDTWSDSEIWQHARTHDLVIVSKDADFSDWIMLANPPPRIVHPRIGNMRMRDFHSFVSQVWPQICILIESHKLAIVHKSRIECIA